jgi:hypothetical protein
VSKSARNDNKPDNRVAANDDRPAAKRAAHPWADVGGIDYGPAVAALGDLVAWAFGLAAADVADWPEGTLRVRSTRKYVLARLRGKHPRGTPYEDILFTAGLLARIFESEIGLDASAVVAVLDRLGLPTEVVPIVPRASPPPRATHGRGPARATPPELWSVFAETYRRLEAEGLLDDNEPDAVPCGECGHLPRYRNAA